MRNEKDKFILATCIGCHDLFYSTSKKHTYCPECNSLKRHKRLVYRETNRRLVFTSIKQIESYFAQFCIEPIESEYDSKNERASENRVESSQGPVESNQFKLNQIKLSFILNQVKSGKPFEIYCLMTKNVLQYEFERWLPATSGKSYRAVVTRDVLERAIKNGLLERLNRYE